LGCVAVSFTSSDFDSPTNSIFSSLFSVGVVVVAVVVVDFSSSATSSSSFLLSLSALVSPDLLKLNK
jgi:hypothetical protein